MKELRKVKSRYEFQLESRQVVLIVSGLILVLMLSFLMGTLFGVNMAKLDGSDNTTAVADEPDNTVAAAEEPEKTDQQRGDQEVAHASSATMSDETIKSQNEKQLTESGNSREDLIRELERLKVPDKVDEKKEAGEKEQAANKTPSTEREESESSEKKSTDAEKDGSASSEKDSSSSSNRASAGSEQESEQSSSGGSSSRQVARAGNYTIQLASFPERQEAAEMVGKLKSSSYDAYMVQVSLPEKGTFYRVRVGHYEDLKQAKKALSIIQSREGKFYDAWITQ
ncbi:MAG: SPOR domain-containing protein [bacterium]